MNESFEAMALRVADELNEVKHNGQSFPARDKVIDDYALAFAARIRDELCKERKPVAWVMIKAWQSGEHWPDDCFSEKPMDDSLPLYLHPAPIPADMVLVPREPDYGMLLAGREADQAWLANEEPEPDDVFESGLLAIYKAMLAAYEKETGK